jgi:hypothetical protein
MSIADVLLILSNLSSILCIYRRPLLEGLTGGKLTAVQRVEMRKHARTEL